MKAKATVVLLTLLMTGYTTLIAQPVRNGVDIIWARDVEGAELTLDGALDEAVWQQADSIRLEWDNILAKPGSGQRIEGTPTAAEPPDPNNGTVYILRDGNVLWLGLKAQDKSIGGGLSLFNFDGLIVNILDRARIESDSKTEDGSPQVTFGVGNRSEFFYTWWNPADTTDADDTYDNGELVGAGRPVPGIEPRLFGFYGVGFEEGNVERPEEKVAVWDARTIVNGIANDDTHGADTSYTMEMRIDLGALGYDFTQSGGDQVPWNIALQDMDYGWPADPDSSFLSRVWWQNQWANNFNEGAAYIYGSPGVTVSSGDQPEVTEPEFTIPTADTYDAPSIDGSLDEPVWQALEPTFYLQYQPSRELLDMNPGPLAKWYVSYWRPDINNDQRAATVVDPSIGEISMFFKDNILYASLNVDDQAISGIEGEDGRDGIRFVFQVRDSIDTDSTFAQKTFEFTIDSTGVIRYGAEALGLRETDTTAVVAAVGLKGSSTAADPSDIDEGYQIEIAFDMVKAFGYPADLGDRRLFVTMAFFDGDFLESQQDSYATRVWFTTERNNGASLYGYLDPNVEVGTAVEDVTEIPSYITLHGNYPNPFNPSTTIHFSLPQTGEVMIEVFDVLGRKVALLNAGIHAAGENRVAFDASTLASGMYLYRLQLKNPTNSEMQASQVGRMVLLK